ERYVRARPEPALAVAHRPVRSAGIVQRGAPVRGTTSLPGGIRILSHLAHAREGSAGGVIAGSNRTAYERPSPGRTALSEHARGIGKARFAAPPVSSELSDGRNCASRREDARRLPVLLPGA